MMLLDGCGAVFIDLLCVCVHGVRSSIGYSINLEFNLVTTT